MKRKVRNPNLGRSWNREIEREVQRPLTFAAAEVRLWQADGERLQAFIFPPLGFRRSTAALASAWRAGEATSIPADRLLLLCPYYIHPVKHVVFVRNSLKGRTPGVHRIVHHQQRRETLFFRSAVQQVQQGLPHHMSPPSLFCSSSLPELQPLATTTGASTSPVAARSVSSTPAKTTTHRDRVCHG